MLIEYAKQASSLAVIIGNVSEGIRGEFASNTIARVVGDLIRRWFDFVGRLGW